MKMSQILEFINILQECLRKKITGLNKQAEVTNLMKKNSEHSGTTTPLKSQV